jgi:hypothetical protein
MFPRSTAVRTVRRTGMLTAAAGISLALAMLPAAGTAAGPKGATIRPIEDFVLMQGTFCFDLGHGCHLFVPPVQNFIGLSDPNHCILASFDYAGLADTWIKGATAGIMSFNTTFAGQVVERPLPDGRALLEINLRTSNALAWAVEDCTFNFAAPLIFGARVDDVLLGAQPVLGEIQMTIRMTNTAPGAPIPDLIKVFVDPDPGQEIHMLGFVATAGRPVASGGGGQLQTVQRGLFVTPSNSPRWDGFPAERITLR